MLRIRDGIVKRTIPGLMAIFLAGSVQMTAQVKADLSASTSLPTGTQQPDTAQKQPTNATAPACNALGDKTANPEAHTVTLSWNASVPASALPRDAVIGYIVYRSTKPNDAGAPPINTRRLTNTTCVDIQVTPGQTYYYVTRAVSASGALSGPSNEVRVQIPPSITSSIR